VASDLVRVVYRKYDGSLHWNQPAWRLGEDEYGVWVGAPAGTPVRLGEQHRQPATAAHAVLLPRDGWWTAVFNAPPHRTEVYCDVTTVPVWTGDEVGMVDLDLDVRRRRGGEVQLLDEDEFAAHRVKYNYPPDVVASAEAAARWLAGALSDGAEPFAGGYRHWLELADLSDLARLRPL
jgi:protein associated with RNAse G/E